MEPSALFRVHYTKGFATTFQKSMKFFDRMVNIMLQFFFQSEYLDTDPAYLTGFSLLLL